MISYEADELRSMSLEELIATMDALGISTDAIQAKNEALTQLMNNAVSAS